MYQMYLPDLVKHQIVCEFQQLTCDYDRQYNSICIANMLYDIIHGRSQDFEVFFGVGGWGGIVFIENPLFGVEGCLC